ncbi:Mitochondrial import inner membrane translocase subunit TIM50 [Zancudomyces culisetae]|uniref:Mitochondrial import inner membrane translocase subunit TIM50 n=1 Tax=Zancudomyces culisetae TaxID=1213189 RepID=A0A1R1PSR8_ZANCU|nr:Mitochondrial import inner membrane translocase subunit TIM50 [Zancudomyces culisetae]OMH83943.1 Mitochondrial import inner membrane translocase subunit TIM50 [Zancudomyces culisetae]|eukprot:OMH82667.1 Mitochondrial import inner membrane translocase subunit TIM50 [Zancudomyces culisetae]
MLRRIQITPRKIQAIQRLIVTSKHHYSDKKSDSDNGAADESLNKNKSGAAPVGGIGGNFGGLASKILAQQTGQPEPEQKPEPESQQNKQEDEAKSEEPKATTAEERRRARRLKASNSEKYTKKGSALSSGLDFLGFKGKGIIDQHSKKIMYWGLIIGLLLGAFGYYGSPYTDQEIDEMGLKDDEEDKDSNQVVVMSKRIYNRMKESTKVLTEPPSTKLLPDLVDMTNGQSGGAEAGQDQQQGPPQYTLVVSLDDLLVHTAWDKEYGWRIAKRPFLEQFLAYMASMYEVVIFSDQPQFSGEAVIAKIDPYGYSPYRLYKEHMRHIKGANYKDLSLLNRDMSKVIFLDIMGNEKDDSQLSLQPDNTLAIRPFNNPDPKDNELARIIPLFEYIYMTEPSDVRKALKQFVISADKNMDSAQKYTEWEEAFVKQLASNWYEKNNINPNAVNEVQSQELQQPQQRQQSWISYLLFGESNAGAKADTKSAASNTPPTPNFIVMRNRMRKNFQQQYKKMIALIKAEMEKQEQENLKTMKESTMLSMAQDLMNGPGPQQN